MTRPSAPPLLVIAFGLSGFAALVDEVVWIRILGELFGHSAHALHIVLAVFFAGVAAGSAASDRLKASGPSLLRAFAAAELGIAACAVAFPFAVDAATPLHDALAPLEMNASAALLARLFVATALLPVPTALMGATLPLVVRSRRGAEGASAARLYAANTLGAAAGAWSCAFVMLPSLGVRATLALAALGNVAAATLAWSLAAREQASPLPDPPDVSRPAQQGALSGRLGAALLFATGLVALALEVVWTRALDHVLEGTVYSVATVLAVLLLGIAGGSALVHGAKEQGRWLAAAQFLLAAHVAASPLLLGAVPLVRRAVEPFLGLGFLTRGLVLESFVCVLVLAPPALAMGVSFPLLLALGVRRRGWGAAVSANTAGGVAGALLAGAVLVPVLGVAPSLKLLALVACGVAVLAALSTRSASPRMAGAACLAVAGVTVLVPSKLMLMLDPRERLVDSREDPLATVSVVDTPSGERRLKVNRTYSMGGGRGVFTERRQGHLPMLLHPHPRRVMVLGVGTGNTLGAIIAHAPEHVLAVELVDGVLVMARRHFAATNEGALDDPRVRAVSADALRAARHPPERFDVIVADLFHPWQAGVGALYSREHFTNVRRALAPAGVFCQWLPLYQLAPADLRTILRTFLDVFPGASAWLGNLGATTPVLALVGSDIAVELRWERWRRALADPRMRPRLEAAYLDRRAEVVGAYLAGPRALAELAGAGPLNTLERPLVEFSAPRALYAEDLESGKRANLRALLTAGLDEDPPLAGLPEDVDRGRLRSERRAAHRLVEALLAYDEGHAREAASAAAEAVQGAPDYDVARTVLAALEEEVARSVRTAPTTALH